MSKKIIQIICYILAFAVFLAGLAIFLYPLANRMLINHNTEERLDGFRGVREESIKTDIDEGKYSQLYYDMKSYNETIFEEGQQGLRDVWSYEQAGFDLSEYGVYNGIVAELRIPKMDTKLPVYMGATTANMAMGAAQMGQTSAPIGGVNTNCVLAAHRGAAGGEFFLYIERLEAGDKVYVDNLWETLTYTVVDIEIIEPDEISKVLIREGEDMLTLITCHPYPTNYQRYAVYCQRQETEQDNTPPAQEESSSATYTQPASENKEKSSTFFINFELALYIIIPILLLVLTIFLLIPKKRNK